MSNPGVYVFIGPLAGFDYKSRRDVTLLSKALNYWTKGGRKEATEAGFDHLSSDAPEMCLIEPLQKSTVETLAAKMATNSLLREVLDSFMKAPVTDRDAFTKAAKEMRKFVPIFVKVSEGEPLSEEWLEARRSWRQEHPLDGLAPASNRSSAPGSVDVPTLRGFPTAAAENLPNGFLLLDSPLISPPTISALRTSPVSNSASTSSATTSPIASPPEGPSAAAVKSSNQTTISISSDSDSDSSLSDSPDSPDSPASPASPAPPVASTESVQLESTSTPEILDALSSATPLEAPLQSTPAPSVGPASYPSIPSPSAPSASHSSINKEISPAPNPPPPPSTHTATPTPNSARAASTCGRGRGRGKAGVSKRGDKYIGKEHFSQRNAQMSAIIEQARAREAAREARMKGEEARSLVAGGEGMADTEAVAGKGERKREDEWVPEDEEGEGEGEGEGEEEEEGEEEIVPAKKRRME